MFKWEKHRSMFLLESWAFACPLCLCLLLLSGQLVRVLLSSDNAFIPWEKSERLEEDIITSQT